MSRRKEERSKQGQTNNKAKQHVHVQSSYNRSLLVHVHVYRHMQERYTHTHIHTFDCAFLCSRNVFESLELIFGYLFFSLFRLLLKVVLIWI